MIPTFLRRHFLKHARRRPWDFCWRIGIESTVVSIAFAYPISRMLNDSDKVFSNLPIWLDFTYLIIIAPVIETLFLQAFPIFIARIFKSTFNIQILSSVLFFSIPHFLGGIGAGICAGLIGGYYLAFSFALWRRRSRWSAFWVTSICHAIPNATAFSMLLFSGNWKEQITNQFS